MSKSLHLYTGLLFLAGINESKLVTAYMYISENVSKKHGLKITGLVFICDVFLSIVPSTFYYWSGGKDWWMMSMIPLCITPIALIGTIMMYESPKHLLDTNQIPKFRKTMKKIADYNRVEDFDSDFEIALESSTENTTIKDDNAKSITLFGNFHDFGNLIA
jgi:hypothetical protein